MTLNSVASKVLLPSTAGWVEVFLIFTLSWVVAGLLVRPILPSSANLQQIQAEEENYSVNIQGLIAAAPFGQPAVAKPTGVAIKSKRSIKLLGTIVAGEQSAALIKAKPGVPEKVFYIGEAVLPGVILRNIESKRILIDVSGRREIIMLNKGSPVNTAPFQSVSDENSVDSAGDFQETLPESGSVIQHLKISRSMLDGEMQNIAKLMTQARITPYFEGGKSSGLQISEIVPGSLYQRIGLRNGDVIGSVNGLSPSKTDQVASIIQTLKNSQSLEISVRRNKQPLKLQYEIR